MATHAQGSTTAGINTLPLAFTYVNSLGRPYGTTNAGIKRVCFEISRHEAVPGCASKIILKNGPTGSESEAVAMAEQFLSKPLTAEYYEMTRNAVDSDTWQEAQGCGYNMQRGCLLSSLIFIEITEMDASGCLTLVCGS